MTWLTISHPTLLHCRQSLGSPSSPLFFHRHISQLLVKSIPFFSFRPFEHFSTRVPDHVHITRKYRLEIMSTLKQHLFPSKHIFLLILPSLSLFDLLILSSKAIHSHPLLYETIFFHLQLLSFVLFYISFPFLHFHSTIPIPSHIAQSRNLDMYLFFLLSLRECIIISCPYHLFQKHSFELDILNKIITLMDGVVQIDAVSVTRVSFSRRIHKNLLVNKRWP